MSKPTFEETMLHELRTFADIVAETGIKPKPDEWHLIALMIAKKYAPQMKLPETQGRPTYSGSDRLFRHLGGLADVAHYKHLHNSTLKEAVEHSLLNMSNFKNLRRKQQALWDMLMERPDVAEVMAMESARPKNTRAFKLKGDFKKDN